LISQLLSFLLVLSFAPVWPQAPEKRPIAPEEVESLVDTVFDSPAAKDWERSATDEQVSAAKFQLQDWVYQHPDQSVRIHAGLVLDQEKFRRLLGDYFAYFSDPEKSFNQLDRVATLSDDIAKSRGLTDEAAKELTRRVFEGTTAGGGSTLADALKPVDWAQLPAGLKLDPKAFEKVRADGTRRIPAERDSLAADRREAQPLGLGTALEPYFSERETAVRRADAALRDFGSVLAKRPQAAESLTADELRLLSHSRNDLYRWLASAALARDENRFRRLRGQLDERGAAERMVSDLALDAEAKARFARRVERLKASLDARLRSAAKLRALLSDEKRPLDLHALSASAEAGEREALALQSEIRRTLEPPRLLRRALRAEAELPWWRRLARWFYTTFLPDSGQGRAYRADAEAARILWAVLKSP
jgi:hypothetical protein